MRASVVNTDGRAESTGVLMGAMIERYWTDMLPVSTYSIDTVFRFVADIPFKPDPPEAETLQRPLLTVNQLGLGGDCDDKVIAFGSYLYARRIPFDIVSVQRPWRDRLHHVLIKLYIGNEVIPADPTYSFNCLGLDRPTVKEVVIWRFRPNNLST